MEKKKPLILDSNNLPGNIQTDQKINSEHLDQEDLEREVIHLREMVSLLVMELYAHGWPIAHPELMDYLKLYYPNS